MEIKEITEIFFQRRFPNKSIEMEKRFGYFQEWEGRFTSNNPEVYMDRESLIVWRKMKKEFNL